MIARASALSSDLNATKGPTTPPTYDNLAGNVADDDDDDDLEAVMAGASERRFTRWFPQDGNATQAQPFQMMLGLAGRTTTPLDESYDGGSLPSLPQDHLYESFASNVSMEQRSHRRPRALTIEMI